MSLGNIVRSAGLAIILGTGIAATELDAQDGQRFQTAQNITEETREDLEEIANIYSENYRFLLGRGTSSNSGTFDDLAGILTNTQIHSNLSHEEIESNYTDIRRYLLRRGLNSEGEYFNFVVGSMLSSSATKGVNAVINDFREISLSLMRNGLNSNSDNFHILASGLVQANTYNEDVSKTLNDYREIKKFLMRRGSSSSSNNFYLLAGLLTTSSAMRNNDLEGVKEDYGKIRRYLMQRGTSSSSNNFDLLVGNLSLTLTGEEEDFNNMKHDYSNTYSFLLSQGYNANSNDFRSLTSTIVYTSRFNGVGIEEANNSFRELKNYLRRRGTNNSRAPLLAGILNMGTADNAPANLQTPSSYNTGMNPNIMKMLMIRSTFLYLTGKTSF